MRIGMMVDMYKPYISGVTNYVAINKRFLEEAGHEVYVFTFGDKDYPDDEPNIIRSGSIGIPIKGFKFYFRYSAKARQLLGTMDVVHVHHPFISGPLALRYCKKRGIPVVFTNHTRYDIYSKYYIPLFPGLFGQIIMGYYLPAFFRRVDLVVSPSPGMRQVLINAGADVPIEVVPNGVDLRAFLAPALPISRAELGFSGEDVIFVFVGRLGLEKNLWFLMEAFETAYHACPEAGLVLIGDGPLRQELQNWTIGKGLDRRVFFTGLVPYEDMPCYLAMADVFVTPSISEVHPFTVIEAMAAGLPVLGIRSPGVGDTVINGATGHLCEVENKDDFSNQMILAVKDKDQRLCMGQQARTESKRYDIHNTMEIMLERYRDAIRQAASKRNGKKTNAGEG